MSPGRGPVTLGPGSRAVLLSIVQGTIRTSSGTVYRMPQITTPGQGMPWKFCPMHLPTQRILTERLGLLEIGDITRLPTLPMDVQAALSVVFHSAVWVRLTDRGWIAARHLILHPHTFVVPTKPLPDSIISSSLPFST